jgi:signal transduction histidine kinase/ActR/RegA family two-component response regulator
MEDLAAPPPPTRRVPASLPLAGSRLGSGRETTRISSPVTFKNRASSAEPESLAPPPAPAVEEPSVSAVALAEQRRLRRQLEAALKEQAATGTPTTEDTVVSQLCEVLWADHACLWMLPASKDEPSDWSRQTIVSEAVAEFYPLTGYSTETPADSWAQLCLEPGANAGGACFQYSGAPFNSPKENASAPSPFSHYLVIPLRGRPGHNWLLLLERYGCAERPAAPWTDFDGEFLEDTASMLGMALENNLLSAQSAERASYLTNMLNSLDVAVMVIEQPPTPVPAVVSLVNRSFCELFGLEKAQVEGGSYLNFMEMARPLLSDWSAQLTIIEDLLADPTAERIDEITLVSGAVDAVPTHLHRFATPARDAHGHIFGRMFFFRDITYDKEVERQLVHSQKMDSIGTLAGGVAHDFNNLLTTILGYTELLKRELKENESSSQKLLQIEKSANRAAELTGQLLAFSRRHPTVLHVFNLNELVTETMDMIRSTVPASIDVQFQPADELPNIEADSTQIQQVLINLILNARDALSGTGKITISTRIGADTQAQPDVQDADMRYAILEVEDNGVGIPKDVLHRIFEPFYTTKEVGKGTGLGLAMVYGIIKKHDGFIEVTSALGDGTKFSAFIPLTHKSTQDNAGVGDPDIRRDPGRKLVVMVVDDEPDLRDFCVTALGEIASDILTAGNGVEALEQFEKAGRKVDLILLDLTMPKMSGPECFQRLRALDPNVRVLISSGYSLDLDAENLIKGSASGFLPKPYDLHQLMESVDRALGNGKPHGTA